MDIEQSFIGIVVVFALLGFIACFFWLITIPFHGQIASRINESENGSTIKNQEARIHELEEQLRMKNQETRIHELEEKLEELKPKQS